MPVIHGMGRYNGSQRLPHSCIDNVISQDIGFYVPVTLVASTCLMLNTWVGRIKIKQAGRHQSC